MNDSEPRNLTPEEQALLEAPTSGLSQTEPLRVPPGTQISIEALDPLACESGKETASPSQPPPQNQ